MAARILFLTLTRNARRDKKIPLSFISSNIESVKQVHIPSTHEESADDFTGSEGKDDLKSRVFRLRLPKRSVTNVLQKWISEGNTITTSDLRSISKDLRKSQRYKHALEISEWMVSHNEYQLSDSDYAVRINLITQVFGIDAAERYFEGLPSLAKTSETCTALLHSYAGLKLIEKAEQLYERMKESNISLTAITFNELMTLYISVGQLEKIPLVVQEMRNQNVAPDLFTYNLRVTSCAAAFKMDEVEIVLDEMLLNLGFDDIVDRYRKLTHIYGVMNSDSSSLVENEKDCLTQRELICYDFLVILYGGLANDERLGQIWNFLRMMGQKLTAREYLSVLSSYLVLGHMKEVSEIIDLWKESANSGLDLATCNKLLGALYRFKVFPMAESLRLVLREKGFEPLDHSSL